MEALELKAQMRGESGTGDARRLRRSGLVPAVLYGRQTGSLGLAVPVKDLEHVISKSGEGALVRIVVPVDGTTQEYLSLIREIQHDPVRGIPMHVDLHQVSMQDKLETAVPLHMVGEPAGVRDGGILQHGLWEVEIECLPMNLPEAISVDVTALGIGDKLTVAGIIAPPQVKILSDPAALVATVTQRQPEKEAAEEETEEAEDEGKAAGSPD